MKLVELSPKWVKHGEYRHLAFECPQCGECDIEIPVPPHPKAWKIDNEDFEHLTMSPSIDHVHGYWERTGECHAHFFIQDGKIINA